MKVKIDTKEKFHVITIEEPVLPANMAEGFAELLLSYLDKIPKNLIINFENVEKIEIEIANALASVQQTFYDANCSLVVCRLRTQIETYLDEKELLELMNITPTESEAGDIIQLEEIEREIS